MATRNLGAKSVLANITLSDVHHAARALKRLNEIGCAPVLSADDRARVSEAKAVCWGVVGTAAEALVTLMDAMAGDPDIEPNGDELEDDDPAEVDDPPEEEGHSEQAAWLERINQALPPLPLRPRASYRNGEDAEDEHDAER